MSEVSTGGWATSSELIHRVPDSTPATQVTVECLVVNPAVTRPRSKTVFISITITLQRRGLVAPSLCLQGIQWQWQWQHAQPYPQCVWNFEPPEHPFPPGTEGAKSGEADESRGRARQMRAEAGRGGLFSLSLFNDRNKRVKILIDYDNTKIETIRRQDGKKQTLCRKTMDLEDLNETSRCLSQRHLDYFSTFH
ncbi:hypothetical protein E2C01_031572 [Portunus trituberculatus]|uniref:Uncharacterized protein n=1 Tax=Portunus trituberculatus TaxID=210409 RepID=A0A5B7EUW9_PORTR|nr:hypothetical protein [Portunus trituberculatus]